MARDISRIPFVDEQKVITPEGALELDRQFRTEIYTTAQITDASSGCNSNRFESKMIWNTTTSRPLWSAGSTRTSAWVDGQGATVHTPS